MNGKSSNNIDAIYEVYTAGIPAIEVGESGNKCKYYGKGFQLVNPNHIDDNGS
jgi:hypothetical protein